MAIRVKIILSILYFEVLVNNYIYMYIYIYIYIYIIILTYPNFTLVMKTHNDLYSIY
jgi:hypothetical protein